MVTLGIVAELSKYSLELASHHVQMFSLIGDTQLALFSSTVTMLAEKV
jgi:hypothetical protein